MFFPPKGNGIVLKWPMYMIALDTKLLAPKSQSSTEEYDHTTANDSAIAL